MRYQDPLTRDPTRGPGRPVDPAQTPAPPQTPQAPTTPSVPGGQEGRPPEKPVAAVAGPYSDPYENAKAARQAASVNAEPAPAPATPATPTLSSMVSSSLMSGLSGEGPFTKQVVQSMDDDLFRAMQGRVAQGQRSASTDAARRGLFRSGIPTDVAAETERAANADYMSGMRKARTDAAIENAKAKQGWLDLATRQDQFDRNLAQQEAQFAASRGGGGGPAAPKTITLTNPDGSTSEVPLEILDMLTSME